MHTSSPTWPVVAPRYGAVHLRAPGPEDVAMVRDLATDPYVPLVSTLPAYADEARALDDIERQQNRHAEGAGFSFVIADDETGSALGVIGRWLTGREDGRAGVGYSVAPEPADAASSPVR